MRSYDLWMRNGNCVDGNGDSIWGTIVIMRFAGDRYVNDCWMAQAYHFVDEDDDDAELEFMFQIEKLVRDGDFSKFERVDLGEVSHIAINDIDHYKFGTVEIEVAA